MDFSDWKPVRRNTTEYLRHLEAFVEEFIPDWIRFPAEPTSIEYAQIAEDLARRMVLGVLKSNERSWREAARKSMRGRVIFEALKNELAGPVGAAVAAMIRENAQLIRTLPLVLAEKTTAYVAKRSMEGVRAEQIEQELRMKLPGVAKRRVKLIARAEVGKTETAITQARSQALGLGWYEWLTSEDSRVRKSHRKMEHVLAAWNDPPSPEALVHETPVGKYSPGQIWNCRCIAAPLVSLDEVRWPHRVYTNGRIEWFTRARFSQLFEVPQAA